MKPPLKCHPHSTPCQRLCTFPNCPTRPMCLLCDHDHVFLPTIRQNLWVDLKKFSKKMDEAIDELLSQTTHAQDLKEVKEQREAVRRYFQELAKAILEGVRLKEKEILRELEGREDDVVGRLRELRVTRGYSKVDQRMFEVLMTLYEGGTLQEKYAEENAKQVYKAQQMLQSTAEDLKEILGRLQVKNVKMPKVPDLSSCSSRRDGREGTQEEEFDSGSYGNQGKEITQAHQIGESKISFQSIITDTIYNRQILFTTCYDKKLRAISKDLFLLKQFQFNNTLQRLIALSEKQYAVAVSRQVQIVNISNDEHMNSKELMKLRGHQSKVLALDSLNTRIIGSCSAECVKIWDLYKQNEQYSIREKSNPCDIKFLQSSKQIAIASLDHSLKLFNVQTLKRQRCYQLPGIPTSLTISQQSRLYTSGFPHTLSYIDTRTPQPISFSIGNEALTCLHVLPCGDVVVGDGKGELAVFDLRAARERVRWEGHDGEKGNCRRGNGVVRVVGSEGFLVSVGGGDRRIKKWNLM